jgi:hypothetical protein
VEVKKSTVTKANFVIAGLLVLLAVSWPFLQKGCHWYYQREAKAHFDKIAEAEIHYKLVNNKYLPFGLRNNSSQLEELELDLKDADHYRFSVVVKDPETFHIIAHLNQKTLKRWYLNPADTRVKLVYEKREGKEGRIIE